MTTDGVLIVSTYSQANYVKIPKHDTTRRVNGVEYVETNPGVSFDFESIGRVPMPLLQGSKMHRGFARGQLDVASAAKKNGISESAVLDFFANHKDFGHSLQAVDKETWQPISKEGLQGQAVLREESEESDFEDRGLVEGIQQHYDRVCGRMVPTDSLEAHEQTVAHKKAKTKWERKQRSAMQAVPEVAAS